MTRRVAIIHYTAPPIPGGVERIIREHVNLLTSNGNQVTVVAGKGGPLRQPGSRLIRIPLLAATNSRQERVARQLAGGSVSSEFAALADEIEADLTSALQDQDIVLAHNSLTLHFNLPLAVALSRLARTRLRDRVVAWTHDIAAVNPLYASEMHDGEPWEVVSTPQPGVRYICISEERSRQLSALWESSGNGPTAEPAVIPNGLDIAAVLRLSQTTRDLVKRHALFDRYPVLLLPVRITRRKNIELAIGILGSLRRQGLDPALIVTGPTAPHHPERSRTYLAELRSRATALGVLDNVVFVAQDIGRTLSEREVADLYAVSDMLFLSSASEGFGLPLLEAAATRLPIVATDLPVFHEIAGESGRYFDLDWPSDRVAQLVLDVIRDPRQIVSSDVKRRYRWDSLYSVYINPLLASVARQSSTSDSSGSGAAVLAR